MTTQAQRIAWEQAEIVRLNGALERPLPLDQHVVPGRVELDGDDLRWAFLPGMKGGPEPAQVLERFVELHERSAADIAKFAQKWGVLGICEHGLPDSHSPNCRPLGWGGAEYNGREPIEFWRRYSRQAAALLRIAARLHAGKSGQAADWRIAYADSEQIAPWWQQTLRIDRIAITHKLNDWLRFAGIGVECMWPKNAENPRISLAGGGLFGLLTTQLVFAVARSDGVALCSGCGHSFTPTRKPRADQRRYCEECRTGQVPLRDAQRDRRRRKVAPSRGRRRA